MKRNIPASNPDAYMAGLEGWRLDCVAELRKNVLASAEVEEVIKWGHLVYFANGPAFLIRAEEQRILFGFWRGQRLKTMEPRLKPGGKYEMATIEIREGGVIAPAMIRKLAKQAVALNQKLGNPTEISR